MCEKGIVCSGSLLDEKRLTQVLTVDWSTLASDNTPKLFGLQDASWIPAVANRVVSELQEQVVQPGSINIVAHSHGTYIAYEIAKHFGGVNSIVALDPSNDVIGANTYDSSQVNFSEFARSSIAFEGS